MQKWWCSIWDECSEQLFHEFLEREDAGQGWPALGDLSQLVKKSEQEIEKGIRERYWNCCEEHCSVTLLSTFRYILSPEIVSEDILVARQGSKLYGIGIVNDPSYRYWPESVNYCHRIKKVEWFAHIFPERKGYVSVLENYSTPDKPIQGIKRIGEKWSRKIDEILAII